VLLGDDPASQVYVHNKAKACGRVGIESRVYRLDQSISQAELMALVDELNQDASIDGILVQLPLPQHINTDAITDAISPSKDVDGFHPLNLGLLAQRRPALRPCTPYGIMCLLKHYQLVRKGAHGVIVGASNIVGRPLTLEFLLAGITVTTCHQFTQDLAKHVKQADILVVAVGKREIVSADWIKPGAIVIDVGMHRLPDGHLAGDLDFMAVSHVAGWLTPVPGGVGPMTIASLLSNTVKAYLER